MREVGRDSASRVARQRPASRPHPHLACPLILLAAILFGGCALSPASIPRQPDLDVSGVWEGTSTLTPCGFFHSESICNAVNLITLVLSQTGSGIRGHYRCDFGNYLCRHDNMDRAGYITDGRISGRKVSMRVMIPADVSSCIFHGDFHRDRASGGYTCYEGGGIVETGIWAVERSY
jgi:hypothetical protein